MVKNIIFDAYGTLLSTGGGSIEATQKILVNNGCKEDAGRVYRYWKKIHKEHIRSTKEFFLTEEEIFVKDLTVIFNKLNINASPSKEVLPMLASLWNRSAFPDVPEVLKVLKKDYEVAIGSTTDTAPLLHNLKCAGLTIEHVFTSEDLKTYKPDAEFYLKIMRKMDWRVNETIFVGDSFVDDVVGPKNVGMLAILIDRCNVYRPENAQTSPDYIISNMTELFGCLEQINSRKDN